MSKDGPCLNESDQARSQAYASTQVLPHRFAKKKKKQQQTNKAKEKTREKDSKIAPLYIYITAIFEHE